MAQNKMAQTKLAQSDGEGEIFLPAWTQACPAVEPAWAAQNTRKADIKKCQGET